MSRLGALCVRVPLVLVLMWSFTTVDTCSLTFAELNILHPGCFPRLLLVRGCRGSCSSYTTPSESVPGHMERFCQCCDVDSMRLRRARILCPNMDTNPPSIRSIVVTMNIPRSCRCRPCTETPEHIIPAEQEFLHNIKRNFQTNVTNSYRNSDWHYLFGGRSPQTMGNTNSSEQNRLDRLLQENKPFIFVQDNALNFSVVDIN